MRKTDKDWIHLGEVEPYWAVMTEPVFKAENISPDVIEDFHGYGSATIDEVTSRFQNMYGTFEPESALDFGCGVGRLTFPMCTYASEVCGVDISPGMLQKAEERKELLKFKM